MTISTTSSNIEITNPELSEEELTSRVAWYYYHDDLTQNEIGDKLNISRIKVSRLLEKGRSSGLIQVTINSHYSGCFTLEEKLTEQFDLKDAVVIPELQHSSVNDRLGQAASQYLMTHLKQNNLLAVGWGDTVAKTLQRMKYVFEHSEISVVSLTGGVTSYVNGMGLSRSSGENGRGIHLIPAPILASNELVAEALLKEPQVQSILSVAETADYALVGIGSLHEKATLAATNYVSTAELLLYQRQGAVGDILGQFYDQRGQLLEFSIHKRTIGLSISRLSNIQCVIGVAGGSHKEKAIHGALLGGYVDILVTDQVTAVALLELSKER